MAKANVQAINITREKKPSADIEGTDFCGGNVGGAVSRSTVKICKRQHLLACIMK